MDRRGSGRAAPRTPADLHIILADAFSRGDIDALLEIYDEDAVVAVPPDGRYVRGRDGIRAAATPVLALRPQMTSVVDMALTHAHWELVATSDDGSPMRLAGRGTVVSRRRPDGTWGIVLDDALSPT